MGYLINFPIDRAYCLPYNSLYISYLKNYILFFCNEVSHFILILLKVKSYHHSYDFVPLV